MKSDSLNILTDLKVPTILPQIGAVVENEFHVQPTNPILAITKQDEQENGLLDIGDDVTNGIEQPNAVRSSLVHYWPSTRGTKDTTRIPAPIVPMVSMTTGTHITEETDLGRWRIDGANANSAFTRLQSLEQAIVSKKYT